MAAAAAVGVDVGGTKIAAGVVDASGAVLARIRAETPPAGGDAVTGAIARVARELSARAGGPLPVGVGAAGIVDADGWMRYSPNIAGWDDVPLAERLRAQLDVPVAVHNDANVAAWGEYRAGAGRAASGTLLMLTVGTGIGGGLVQDGRLVRGASGMAAEFGHIVVSEGGPRCGCGNHGCLEAMASGTAIGRLACEALDAGGASPLLRREDLPTGKTVTAAARQGDAFAREVLARAGFWLGVGIASLVNALDPEVVVVGGGAMQAGELLLGPARESYLERLMGRAHRTSAPVVEAELGDDAGLIGAALLALDAR